jgi:hypothetical protein
MINLGLLYQCLLAVGAIIIFFTKLDVYLEKRGWCFLPLYWVVIFTVAAFPLILSFKSRIKWFSFPLFMWCCLYFAISLLSLISVLPFGAGMPIKITIQDLETRILSILFLLLMSSIFAATNTLVHLWCQRTILIVAFLNVFNIIYEFFDPLAFGALDEVGRPAGFYINANEAGIGLILSLILSINIIKPRYRFLLALIIGSGIILTFSRGSILGWIVTVTGLVTTKIIPRRQFLFLIFLLSLLLILLVSQLKSLSYLTKADGSPLLSQGLLQRIEWIQNPIVNRDPDNFSRLRLLKDGWQKFSEKPFLGNGIGSSRDKNNSSDDGGFTGIRPHNLHLSNMIEHGFLGFLILPILLLATTWKARGEVKNLGIVFVTFYMVAANFSHILLINRYNLLAFSLMASMSVRSRLVSNN